MVALSCAPESVDEGFAPTSDQTAVVKHPVLKHPVVTIRGILRQVIRNAVPHLIEATFVPALLFYIAMVVFGTWAAFAVALVWSYGAIVRRYTMRSPVPPILLLSTVALTARTAITIASGSTFIYFFQPILGTLAMAFVFLGSVAIGKPLIGKLATDFWPLEPEVAAHPEVLRLFRGLTYLWAGVNLATASVTFVLLLTLPIEGFLAAKMLTGYLITFTGIVVTIVLSMSTARREGLVTAAFALN